MNEALFALVITKLQTPECHTNLILIIQLKYSSLCITQNFGAKFLVLPNFPVGFHKFISMFLLKFVESLPVLCEMSLDGC